MEPIKGDNWSWGEEKDWDIAIDQDQTIEMKKLLLGHSVAKVSDDHLEMDDGTVIKVVPNTGGCACSAGDYELTHLEGVENVITRVELAIDAVEDDWGYGESTYRIFVFTADGRFELATIEGDDGNGYYGTGYELLVRLPK